MELLPGQTLGRYQIVEKIAAGGMAQVYSGFDPGLSRYVAIKVLSAISQPSAPPQSPFSSRFISEARTLAALSHPNIVQIFDYGEQDGLVYLVMEYIGGGTLADWTGRPQDPRQAAALLIPIAQALDAAHRRGIVHRDLKPANILMDGNRPVLSDFGISRLMDRSRVDPRTILPNQAPGFGTPAYMSPEQLQGLEAGPVGDIYSLGVVYYELVTGKPPFISDTPWGIALRHLHEPPALLIQFNPDAPIEAQRLIDRALAKDPADRYPDMAAMCRDLEELARGTSAAISQNLLAGQKSKWFLPIFTMLLVLCGLTGLAAATILWRSWSVPFPPAQTGTLLFHTEAGLQSTEPLLTEPVFQTAQPSSPSSTSKPGPVVTPNTMVPVGLEDEIAAFIRTYFETVNRRDYSVSWQMLSDNFKNSRPGRNDFEAYGRFWDGFDRVEVVDVRARVVDPARKIGEAIVTLRYDSQIRGVFEETYTYRVIYSEGGWQIDL